WGAGWRLNLPPGTPARHDLPRAYRLDHLRPVLSAVLSGSFAASNFSTNRNETDSSLRLDSEKRTPSQSFSLVVSKGASQPPPASPDHHSSQWGE
ncbi:MAG TPA: hypothetical protein VFC95_04355, partial [Guyparkeria sp.]|nr:hypothetical protein [Guyparkeria sp.]